MAVLIGYELGVPIYAGDTPGEIIYGGTNSGGTPSVNYGFTPNDFTRSGMTTGSGANYGGYYGGGGGGVQSSGLTPQYFGQSNWRDVGNLAATAWGEARGEPLIGQAITYDTMLNRTRDPHWSRLYGTNPADQALAGGGSQYNVWMPDNPNYKRTREISNILGSGQFTGDNWNVFGADAPAMQNSLLAMRGVFGTGGLAGIAEGAQFYANPNSISAKQRPVHQALG